MLVEYLRDFNALRKISLVMRVDRVSVGIAELDVIEPYFPKLELIQIDRPHSHKGYGTQFLKYLNENFAGLWGQIYAVNHASLTNAQLAAWYAKHGATVNSPKFAFPKIEHLAAYPKVLTFKQTYGIYQLGKLVGYNVTETKMFNLFSQLKKLRSAPPMPASVEVVCRDSCRV